MFYIAGIKTKISHFYDDKAYTIKICIKDKIDNLTEL